HDVRMRRELVVRQDLPVREREDLERWTAEEAQLGRQPVEFTRVRRQANPQPMIDARRFGQRERTRAGVQRRPAQTAGTRAGQGEWKQDGHAKVYRAGLRRPAATSVDGESLPGPVSFTKAQEPVATASMTRSFSKNTEKLP